MQHISTKMKNYFLFFWWSTLCCWWLPFLSCIQALSQEELTTIEQDSFGVDLNSLKHYEIVYPIELKTTQAHTKQFLISAFGQSYDIFIKQKDLLERTVVNNGTAEDNFNNNIYVEYIDRNNSYQGKYWKPNNCFYNGPSVEDELLYLVLDYCDGLEGMIENENVTLFIEPIKTPLNTTSSQSSTTTTHRKHLVYRSTDVKHKSKPIVDHSEKEPAIDFRLHALPLTRRRRRSGYQSFLYVINRSNRKVQVYYYDLKNRLIPFILLLPNEGRGINTFESTKWVVKDDKTDQIFFLNGRSEYTSTVNSQDKRYELVITVPPGTVFNDETSETNEVGGADYYIQVMILADKSMVDYHGKTHIEKYLNTMNQIVAGIFKHKSLGSRVHYKVVKIVLLESDDIGFSVYEGNPSRTLRSACEYTTSLKHSDEKHPDHFDVGIAITRKQFGPSGYAQMYSMCSNRRSCAIVNDEGLTSSFIVAHEVAHLLGLDHDGEGDSSRCKDDQSRGSVMAPVIVSSYSRYHWSSCSREVLKVNIGYFSCLENNPNKQKEQASNKLPGSSYTIDEQCKMSHQGSSKCQTFDFNPCHRLWCSSTERKCISRGPALSGTVCGKNKFCFKGECVEEEDNRTKLTKQVVHGQWGRWTSWSSCSQSCGVGLRFRSRECDSPRPGPRGRDCSGNKKEMDICSTQPCRLTKSYQTILNEQCSSIRDEKWIRYKDQDFENRLRQPRNNLNCTFENGMCNWQKEAIRSDLEWHVQSGPTNSRQTGPSSDHTTGNKNGKYIYMEASSTYHSRKQEGDVARLVSRVVQVPRVCFTFYYHMYGRDMGSLRVNIRFKNGTEVNRWNITGNQGDRWQSARISVEHEQDFQFIIEAVRGGHWSGDIAVDDFAIDVGSCPEVRDLNPCKVSCRSRSALSFTLNLNVRDGVNCNPNPRHNDICLKGICVPFGCDNQFGSTLKLDNCGVCGGNGSTCSMKAGTKKEYLKQSYEVVFKIKKGSTFINFVEKSDQFLYYGIRKRSNNAIQLSTSQEDYFMINDVTFHFYKDNGRQRIVAKGPIKEDLEVMVFSYQRSRVKPVVLDYELFEPKAKGYTYEYRVTSWEPCSMSCGTGKQKSLSRCVRTDDDSKVSDSFCEGIQKPTLNYRTCKLKPCPERYIWTSRQWRECNQSCGGGHQYRKIDCIRAQDSALVSHRYCKAGDKPEEMKICNTNKCYRWKAREWSSCSVSCGKGVRIRLTTCMDGDLAVEPEKCREENRPRDHEVCQLQECEKFRWRIMFESACSKSCGGGNKAVIVNCVKVRKPNVLVDNEFCTGPEPARLKKCSTQACPEYVWKFGEEGPCSATCGSGTRERSVICVDQATEVETNEKNCKEKKPDIVVPCNERLCMRYKVAYSAWKDCDVMCGLGVQKRNPYCITEDYKRVVDADFCGKQAKVMEERVCQKSSCAKPADLKCSFSKESTCKWENGQTDDFDWSIGKRTPSLNTGPNSDHTTTNGYFAYIEASRPRRVGDRATLVSPIVRAKRGCLTFWYHMRGSTVGHLRLYLSTSVASNVLFEQKGEKGRKWLLATVDVSPSSGTLSGYKFIFEGKVGRAAYGDIAIDDINFYDQSCKDLNVFHNPILENCRERSPLCKKQDVVERYCRESQQFQLLCCRTCVQFMNKNSYTLTHS